MNSDENQALKASKFRRLSEIRLRNVQKNIRLLGNLANKSHYEYSKEMYTQMFEILNKELKRAKLKYEGNGDSEDNFFRWDTHMNGSRSESE